MSKSSRPITEEIQGTLDEIIAQVKRLIREGNARRVIIKNKKGEVLFQSQLTIGVAGTALFALYAPVLTAITTFVLYASDVRVFVEKNEESDSDGEYHDEYEVDAEIIDIEDEDDNDDSGETEKTVGKK